MYVGQTHAAPAALIIRATHTRHAPNLATSIAPSTLWRRFAMFADAAWLPGFHKDECTQSPPGFDMRNIWWNPNDSKLQANGYNGIGYASLNLDANKSIAGNFTFVKQVWSDV
jgi:hypothetical protein